MSLRDQLLKSGLVSKKQVSQAESSKKKQEHDAKKNKDLQERLNQEKQKELSALELEKQTRYELDRELNKKRDLLMAQRESYYRAVQLINANSQNSRQAEEPYFFLEDERYVRKVWVTPSQREMLARGKLAVARPYDDSHDFVLISISAAKILREIFPSKLLVLHSEVDDQEF